jgi:DNA end-binding protein Ku
MISFGLVSIPIRLFPAAVSERVSFHLLHAKCGSRIKYQTFCPVCDRVIDRSELVKGYEFAKDQYVRITEDELEALEGEASKEIDIAEFVPLETVDPVFLDKTYYLGPDKGGAKPYQLLTHALEKTKRVALARFILRGKESLVLIRAAQEGLMLHTMYFHDEIRDFGEIDKGASTKFKDAELGLAMRLIDELSDEEFDPKRYEDEYRRRVLAFVEKRSAGQEVAIAPTRTERGKVIDLMDALKKSLGRRKETAEAKAKNQGRLKDLAKAPRRAIEASSKGEKRIRAARR